MTLSRRNLIRGVSGLTVAAPFIKHRELVAADENHARIPGGYPGMADSAAWRSVALERIERLRKGDFRVSVKSAGGHPVPNAEIRISLARHHFGFGAAVQARHLFELGTTERQAFYRETTSRYFHRVTIANGLKWKHYAEQRANVEKALEWCLQEQLPVRGHCLVWPRFRRIPDELHHLANDRSALRRAIEDHVTEFVSMYDEPLVEWDVLNEPFMEHEFMDLLGPEVVYDWFRLARDANPRLIRYINDYGVLTRPDREHQDFYFDYVRGLLEAGVPVQGIGFQGHIPERFEPTPPEELLATMDRFSALGLPLQVTEFDFETTDPDLQARYTSDFLIAVFSHRAMVGLVTWTPFEYGRGEGSKPDAAFFDYRLREKPNGHEWDSLVNHDWRTDVDLVSDERGHATFRGFKGSYVAEASRASAAGTGQGRLTHDNDVLTVKM